MTADLIPLLIAALALVHVGSWGILFGNLAYLRRQKSVALESYPSLSICIPARNEAENLRRLLPSLTDQKYPKYEVIVCNDRSEDETGLVLDAVDNANVEAFEGTPPPDGWVGKVHALYQCTRRASGEVYLFLDADTELLDPYALRRLIDRHAASPSNVSTGFPHLRGAAMLLVSLVPYAILSSLPWPLVRTTDSPSLSALNGQCWVIGASLYHRHEPHAAVRGDILEDVSIGRFLKDNGQAPVLLDVQDLVAVYMYDGYGAAWRGFRKNAYLLMGGSVFEFLFLYTGFALAWVVAPILSTWFLGSLYGLKFVTDRASGMPLRVSLLAPVSFLLALGIQLDSAVHHWTDRVTWKGRSVSDG